MKKKLFLLVPAFALVLTGCGSDSNNEKEADDNSVAKKVTCTLSSSDAENGYSLDSTYIINYKDNYVESVNTTETVTSENEQILSYFEETLNASYEQANETYGGYTFTVKNEDGKVVSQVTIDYTKMNLEQFIEDQPTIKDYTENNKITVSGLKSMYTQMGATCK